MLVHADARRLPLRDESVQCVVTSPPFWGLRDYGIPGQIGLETRVDQYVSKLVRVFREVRRVLRSDGTLWLNLGDTYCARPNSGAGNGSVLQGRKIQDAQSAGRLHKNARIYPPDVKPKDLIGIPWAVAFALRRDGWFLRAEVIWAKLNPIPESIRDRPTKAHEQVFLLTRSGSYRYNADAIKEPGTGRAPGNRAPHKYAESGDSRTTAGLERMREGYEERNARSVWTMASEPYAGEHPATFPSALARRCILAGTAAGDVVLDPFVGSGTTVRAARDLGRVGVGVDLNPNYLRGEAAGRIRTTAGMGW